MRPFWTCRLLGDCPGPVSPIGLSMKLICSFDRRWVPFGDLPTAATASSWGRLRHLAQPLGNIQKCPTVVIGRLPYLCLDIICRCALGVNHKLCQGRDMEGGLSRRS